MPRDLDRQPRLAVMGAPSEGLGCLEEEKCELLSVPVDAFLGGLPRPAEADLLRMLEGRASLALGALFRGDKARGFLRATEA